MKFKNPFCNFINKLSPNSKSKFKHDDSDSSKSQFYDDINASKV